MVKVHHLTPAEHDGKLHFVPLFEEFGGVIDLDVAVMVVNFRPETDFLERDRMLLLVVLLGFPLLLKTTLNATHYPAYGRRGIG